MIKTLNAVLRASALTLAVSLSAPNVGAQTPAPTFSMRDADHPARAAFQITLCTPSYLPGCGDTPSQYLVPAGHRLMIDFVSGRCVTGSSVEKIGAFLLTTRAGGTTATHYFVPSAGTLGTNDANGLLTHPTRVYGDPETPVAASVFASPGNNGCLVALSGNLVKI